MTKRFETELTPLPPLHESGSIGGSGSETRGPNTISVAGEGACVSKEEL